MANENYVKFPTKGVNLICIDPAKCETTLPYSNTSVPVLYGVTQSPTGFRNHDVNECPVPRTAYFENVEEYWKQDFMKTFTDCLGSSTFGPSISNALSQSSISYLHGFQGSSRTQAYSSHVGSFPYKCCFLPTFYQAYVRGTTSTGYFNPIFSSNDDFNCSEQNGCLGYGSMDSFYKATPHSVMWYLLHSMASITLVTNSTSFTVPFWQSHTVGQTHTSLTIRSTLLQQASLLGATQRTAFTNSLLTVPDSKLQSMVGNHFLLSLLTFQNNQQDGNLPLQYDFFCPNTQIGQIDTHSNWYNNTTDIINFPYYYIVTTTDQPFDFNNLPILEGFPGYLIDDQYWRRSQSQLINTLECCTNDENVYPDDNRNDREVPMSFLGSVSASGAIIFPSYTTFISRCRGMLCQNSPICHNFLFNYCTTSERQTSKYCQKFNSWAARNYRSVNSRFSTFDGVLPVGAYATGVDTSIAAQMYACSVSKGLNQTLTRYYNDMCVSLFSTTYQSNFPRLRTFHWGDPIQYLTQSTQLYILPAQQSGVNIMLTYSAYSFTQNTSSVSPILGTSSPNAFVCMPMQLSVSLASFSLSSKDIFSSSLPAYKTLIQQLFNKNLFSLQGRFPFPSAPTPSYTQTFSTPGGITSFTIRPAYPNFSTAQLTWNSSGLNFTHSTIVTERRSRFDVQRQQDINFLYSISSLRSVNSNASGTSFQNSSADTYASFSTVFNSLLVNPSPQGIVDSSYKKLPFIDALPTLTVQMNSNVLWALGLSSNPSIIINPLSGGTLSIGTYTQTFTNPLTTTPRSNINAIYGAVFSLTNISPVSISSLTALVQSNKSISVQSLDPQGNPTLSTQILSYSVTFNTRSLGPFQSALCTVSQTNFIGTTYSADLFSTPILFYDSFTNQTSLSAFDFPILGGISAIRTLKSKGGWTPYKDNKFSTFVSDTSPINGISYLSNQNIYDYNSSTQSYIPLNLTILPLIGGS
jgi:hypothetical protein